MFLCVLLPKRLLFVVIVVAVVVVVDVVVIAFNHGYCCTCALTIDRVTDNRSLLKLFTVKQVTHVCLCLYIRIVFVCVCVYIAVVSFSNYKLHVKFTLFSYQF